MYKEKTLQQLKTRTKYDLSLEFIHLKCLNPSKCSYCLF